MQVFHTTHQAFRNLTACFEKLPKAVPVFSIIIADEKKPLSLLCLYHDAGVVFLHGLFKSKFCSLREFGESVKFAESYLSGTLSKSFSVVVLTEKKWLKRILEKNNFKSEPTTIFFQTAGNA